jgi:hypothetical protein
MTKGLNWMVGYPPRGGLDDSGFSGISLDYVAMANTAQ